MGVHFPSFNQFMFLFFNVFHSVWDWDQCCCQVGLLSPILLASSLHSIGRVCGFAPVLPLSLFVLWFPFSARRGEVCSEIDSKSRGHVPWGAGWAPSSSGCLWYPSPFPTPFLFPQAEFFRLQTSPQQPFHY